MFGSSCGSPSLIHADGIEERIRHPKGEVLVQPSLHELRADLQVVPAVHIGHIRLDAPIGQRAVLRDRRRRVVKRIARWDSSSRGRVR